MKKEKAKKAVLEVLDAIKIASVKLAGEILFARNLYDTSNSANSNARKILEELTAINKLEKIRGGYRVKGCKSELKGHSLKLSQTLTELYKIPDVVPVVIREKKIPINLIPDALVLLMRNGKGACFVLEEVNEETEDYLNSKVQDWRSWEKANEYLGQLFNYEIPHFDIVVSGAEPVPVPMGCYSFENYIKEVMKDG